MIDNITILSFESNPIFHLIHGIIANYTAVINRDKEINNE